MPCLQRAVGVIGTGWYGKCSLFRLLQVDPTVQVVGLCDVDKHMVAEAAKMVEDRSGGKSKPQTFADYREMCAKLFVGAYDLRWTLASRLASARGKKQRARVWAEMQARHLPLALLQAKEGCPVTSLEPEKLSPPMPRG